MFPANRRLAKICSNSIAINIKPLRSSKIETIYRIKLTTFINGMLTNQFSIVFVMRKPIERLALKNRKLTQKFIRASLQVMYYRVFRSFHKSDRSDISANVVDICHCVDIMSVADLRGARGMRAPPGGPNSFNFMQFLGKFGKIVCWRPPGDLAPPPRGNPGSATACYHKMLAFAKKIVYILI